MAKIFRYQGIKLILYSDDHDPEHYDGKSANFEVKLSRSQGRSASTVIDFLNVYTALKYEAFPFCKKDPFRRV